MKRLVKATTGPESLETILTRLVSELQRKTQEFCTENDLSYDTWDNIGEFDPQYDETVDVNFSITVDIPESEQE